MQGDGVGVNDQGMGAGAMVVAGGGGKGVGDVGVEGLLASVAAGQGGGEGTGETAMLAMGIVGFGVEGEAPAEPGMGRMPSLIANHGFQVCLGFAFFVGGGGVGGVR